ncbi:MAG TPA: acyl-CoA dehydrogenase [Acidimicrobiales bacterium]|nr:acyl-CoA dehydrogenase [Acidimicrobiales bacterium]
MRFAFTAQQLEFRDAVRAVLAKECTPADLRVAYGDRSWRTPRWATLAGLGAVGMTVPERHGGLGLGLVDLVLVLEEAGRAALPEPLAATTAVAAPILADLEANGPAGDGRWRAWLADIAGGAVAAAVGTGAADDPVAGADGATHLVLARPASGPEAAFYVLAPEELAPGACTVEPVGSLDPTRRLARVTLGPRAEPVATGEEAAGLARTAARRATVATAAELLGVADRLVAMGADYARERRQFGRPVGSFQAVKHLLAGPRVALEFARPAVYAAAWALDEGELDAPRRVSAAKAQASDAALEAARVALQVHGAIGYTWECDLHLFLKRAWALAAAWGSATEHRRRVLAGLVAERSLTSGTPPD